MESARNPWLVLVSVGFGLFMVVIDITILNIALPTLAADLDASLAAVQWTLIAYTLALAGLVPFFGRISDVIGRKRLFSLGLAIFAAASLLAALSPSIPYLIGARILQAFGGAIITSNTLAIITDTFPVGKRGAAMGVQSIIISGGAAVGPSLGGFLVTNFGWQAVFLINVPIGISAVVVATIVLPPLKSNRTLEPIDWVGAFALTGGLVPLLFGVTRGPTWGWTSGSVLGAIGVGLAVMGLFVLREARARFPLVDLTLFKIREFAAGQTAGLFTTMSLSSMTFVLPFYWQGLRGFSAQTAGLLFLPVPLSLMVSAPLAGRLSDRFGARGLSTGGLVVIMIGLFLISQLTATTPIWEGVLRIMVFGTGIGMFMAPNNNAVMSAVPAEKRGIAAGLLGMFRFTGQSIGITFGGTVFAVFVGGVAGLGIEGLPSPDTLDQLAGDAAALEGFQHAFTKGLRGVSLVAIPFAAVAAVLSLLRGKPEEGTRPLGRRAFAVTRLKR